MFGANLRVLSKQYSSISELTRQLGINRTQFNRYLSGESFPRPDVLDRICNFFNVDARILLEPVNTLTTHSEFLSGPVLKQFVGAGLNDIPDTLFPSGFYRFCRRSFVDSGLFLVGLVYVFRSGSHTFVRGYESLSAMKFQGLPTDARTREFRGFVMRQEDGIVSIMSHRNAMTCSFNYLAPAASFDNSFWLGYVTRTVPESATSTRITRMTYEYLGNDLGVVLTAARATGFRSPSELLPFHARLLQVNTDFR